MTDVTRHTYLTTRKGSRNLYYKREVPPELRAVAQRRQIWISLGTPDQKVAAHKYAAEHHRVETEFARWRDELNGTVPVESGPKPETVVLTPSLSRRVVAQWKAEVVEREFQARADLWENAQAAPDDLIQGRLLPYEECEFDPVLALLEADKPLEEVFLCVLRLHHIARRNVLKRRHDLGNVDTEVLRLEKYSLALCAADLRKLARQCQLVDLELLGAWIKGLPALTVEPELEPLAASTGSPKPTPTGPLMSALIPRYVAEESKLKEWPLKDEHRWRAMLKEWVEIVGDKPVNAYTETDGAAFRTVQISLPVRRAGPRYRGLNARQCVERADTIAATGGAVQRLSALTIKDKIGCVNRFFRWAKTVERSTVNPVEDVKIERPKKRNRGKARHPWKIDELNAMFQTPVYTGCRSQSRWKEPGDYDMRETAEYWVPLIGLFSGLRLGEIIQLHKADVRQEHGIWFFDVTNESDSPQDNEDAKSVKTAAGHRKVPIHQVLLDLGLLAFVKQRGSNHRLFPDYQRSKSDHSWSKTFSQHFRRFRMTFTQRDKIGFHSLRHNFEDALRAAMVGEDIRDALQGHEGDGGTGRDYGAGYPLDILNTEVQRISYKGLVLPRRPPPNP